MKPAYKKDDTDWDSKEKRDMYLRVVISNLINKPDSSLESVYKVAKDVVDNVWKTYPNGGKAKEQDDLF